ncbi:MAG TPA: hypothetical protein VFJ10_02360 [Acidobacteriaceae bacterium]|jgi:hypothetical protein|nr:hypothetical protein [Acidobacteriaceae bacterium]
MQTKTVVLVAVSSLIGLAFSATQAQAQAEKSAYPAAAPLEQYLMPDSNAEIALARTAAPASVSGGAEVLVLGRNGYMTAVKGTNGFVCLVERGFAAGTDFSEFWSPKNRSPNCVNAAAARSYLPVVLMRAKLAMAGKSKTEIAEAIRSAVDSKQLPEAEPGAMSYMLSKEQYLNDAAKNWRPHLMWFVRGDSSKSWGAGLPGSPILADKDLEDRMTIFMVPVAHWSDGTAAP